MIPPPSSWLWLSLTTLWAMRLELVWKLAVLGMYQKVPLNELGLLEPLSVTLWALTLTVRILAPLSPFPATERPTSSGRNGEPGAVGPVQVNVEPLLLRVPVKLTGATLRPY